MKNSELYKRLLTLNKKAEYNTAMDLKNAIIKQVTDHPYEKPLFFLVSLGFNNWQEFMNYKSEVPEFKEVISDFFDSLPKETKDFINSKLSRSQKKPYQSGDKISKRLKQNTFSRVNQAIKRKRNTKYFYEIFGYHQDDLKKHLESKFTDGMNWDNYGVGGWHIDHIKPVSWFDWKEETQSQTIKECWALDNLQPLWASQNSIKGNRYSG